MLLGTEKKFQRQIQFSRTFQIDKSREPANVVNERAFLQIARDILGACIGNSLNGQQRRRPGKIIDDDAGLSDRCIEDFGVIDMGFKMGIFKRQAAIDIVRIRPTFAIAVLDIFQFGVNMKAPALAHAKRKIVDRALENDIDRTDFTIAYRPFDVFACCRGGIGQIVRHACGFDVFKVRLEIERSGAFFLGRARAVGTIAPIAAGYFAR